jgi:hypothetical protein
MAIKDVKLTPSGDIELNLNAQPSYIYGKDALEQICRVAISLWKGNWFRDARRGVDWLNVFKLRYSRAEIIDTIASALRRVQYVGEVVDVSVRVIDAARTAEITYTVKSDGNIIVGREVV